jgi:DNA-directed RNA polymerase subunit RPC12/RpoP
MLLEKKLCETCGAEFRPKKSKQLYCCRKCFKKAYYRRTVVNKFGTGRPFPEYTCPNCGKKNILDFDPSKDYNAWLETVCKHCGVRRYTGERDFKGEVELAV